MARNKALEAKSSVERARRIFRNIEGYFSEEDAKLFRTYIEYEERWGVLAYKTANIEKLGNALFDEIISQENLELSILKVELLERGHS